MKISPVIIHNFKTLSPKINQAQKLFQNPIFDRVTFTSSPKQTLKTEAKDTEKSASDIFLHGKNIQTKANRHIKDSVSLSKRAHTIQDRADIILKEALFELDWAREHNLKASAGPGNNSQIIFSDEMSKNYASMTEYKNDLPSKSVEKTPKETTIFVYTPSGKAERYVFDTKTSMLLSYDDNYKAEKPPLSYSDASYIFKNGQLKSINFGFSRNPKGTRASERYEYQDNKPSGYLANSRERINGIATSDEKYVFADGKLSHYFKKSSSKKGAYDTSEEEFIFDNNYTTYVKGRCELQDESENIGEIYVFRGQKLKKALKFLSGDFSTRTVDKIFVFDKKPLRCHINCQTKEYSTYDLKNDDGMECGQTVYLD